MSTRLDENLGAVGFDNLINGVNPPAEVFHVEVAGGQGLLKRGTLLVGNDGKVIADGESDCKAPAILAEDTDTGEAGGTVTAIAYRTGHFNANSLIVGEGFNVNETKEALRGVGILISDAVEV